MGSLREDGLTDNHGPTPYFTPLSEGDEPTPGQQLQGVLL